MAMPHPSGSSRCLALAVAICTLLPGCFSSETEQTIFKRALQCFDDHNVYNGCALELRLGVEGVFHVGSESVDAYCGGACLVETKMALQCVEEIGDEGFRFSNGASVLAVKAALVTGCSYTPERGTFEEQLGHGEQEQYHGQYQGGEPHYEDQFQGGGYSDYCSGAAGSPARMLLMLIFFIVSAMSMLLAAV